MADESESSDWLQTRGLKYLGIVLTVRRKGEPERTLQKL